MKFAILGAGGIGCYYGARLLDAGFKVDFIARGKHLEVLKENGLQLEHPAFNYKNKINAFSIEELFNSFPQDYEAILLCTKATATLEIAKRIRNWFNHTKQNTLIISLQNGVDNEAQLAKNLGANKIIGGLAVRIGGHIISPGIVKATGIAQVILGIWPKSKANVKNNQESQLSKLVDSFNKALIPTQLVPDIRRELWRKLVINNGVNPLSVLTGFDTKSLTHDPNVSNIVYQLMSEAARAAQADDELLTKTDVDEMFELIRSFEPIKTSMLIDFEKGRQLEIDAISGAVLKRSKKLGLEAPYSTTMYALLKVKITKNE